MNGKKYILVIGIGCVLSFFGGFLVLGKIHLGIGKRGIWFIEEQNNARNCHGWNLEGEDAEFLEEYVLGEWKFSRLLDNGVGWNFDNWDGDGMENLKIVFDENETKIKGYHQETFSNIRDAYSFTELMVGMEINQPVYHIIYDAEFLADYEFLMQVFKKSGKSEAEFLGESVWKVVSFDVGYDTYQNPSVSTWYEDHLIYVNPSDRDKIYLRFCGLWELDRAR